MGQLLRLIDVALEAPAIDYFKVARVSTKYYFFYPLSASVKHDLCKHVGNFELSSVDAVGVPMVLPLLKGIKSPPKWEIIFPNGSFRRAEKLNVEQLDYSIYEAINHANLVDKIECDWTPRFENIEYERKQKLLMSQSAHHVVVDTSSQLVHLNFYFYFPTKPQAQAAIKSLKSNGYPSSEHRRAADGLNWLVLMQHSFKPSDDIAALRTKFERMAGQHGGEYDGWENTIR